MKYRLRAKMFEKNGNILEGVLESRWPGVDCVLRIDTPNMVIHIPLEDGCHLDIIPEVILESPHQEVRAQHSTQIKLFEKRPAM